MQRQGDPNWLVGTDREKLFRQPSWTYATEVGTRLHNHAELRAYLEKEHPDWLRALTPRHINAPANYWPQKLLGVSSANAAMQNYVSIYEHQTSPNPALVAVHGQAAVPARSLKRPHPPLGSSIKITGSLSETRR